MSKLGKNHGPFFCEGCKQEFRPHHSTAGKFCSNQCQRDKEFADRYARWLAGEETNSPKWLRRALAHRDGHRCAVCDLTEWMEQPITLELDHIDGSHANNNLSNLRLICPNCHSQTITYKNRNKGRGRPYRRKHAEEVGQTVTSL